MCASMVVLRMRRELFSNKSEETPFVQKLLVAKTTSEPASHSHLAGAHSTGGGLGGGQTQGLGGGQDLGGGQTQVDSGKLLCTPGFGLGRTLHGFGLGRTLSRMRLPAGRVKGGDCGGTEGGRVSAVDWGTIECAWGGALNVARAQDKGKGWVGSGGGCL